MQLFYFDTLDSTNDEAKRRVHAGTIREPTCLLARTQTAGRGSRGRTWLSPKDAGIYLTLVDQSDPASNPVTRHTAFTAALTLATGIACVEALRMTTNLNVELKPVNDLYMDGRKLGGILTETIIRKGHIEAIVTGIGINVRRAERTLPKGTVTAVCLEELLSPEQFKRVDLNLVVATIIVKVLVWNATVLLGRKNILTKSWQQYNLPLSALEGM